MQRSPEGVTDVVVPVVGECDDSWLDDILRRNLTLDHVREALDSASDGPVAEGVVGAGTGMITMGHKGGVGTASRVIDGLGTVGVLLLCNFGGCAPAPDRWRAGGRDPRRRARHSAHARRRRVVHRHRPSPTSRSTPASASGWPAAWGSASPAWARSPTTAAATSSSPRPRRTDARAASRASSTSVSWPTRLLDPIFGAVVDAAEEAVTNALFVADTVTGVGGHVVPVTPRRPSAGADRTALNQQGSMPTVATCA